MEKDLLEIEKRNLIIRERFNSAQLMRDFPPKIFNKNKKIIFEMAWPSDCIHGGDLVFSKWSQINWSDTFSPSSCPTQHIMEENFFQYQSSPFAGRNSVEWHVNFADRHLFGYYGGGLFAQDEMQVAEHPILGSLKECLNSLELEDSRVGPYTRDVDSSPTPILIRGAERRVKISTDPNASEGRPEGLYGKKFSNADETAIRNATKLLSPPTITNLIAMEAPKYGKGSYSLKLIKEIFNTAHTAFVAARVESRDQIGSIPQVIIHTGNWGTGAYGGNKTIMTILQMFSARVAGIDYLVYHTSDAPSSKNYEEGLQILNNELMPDKEEINVMTVLFKIEKMKFEWGVSDGN